MNSTSIDRAAPAPARSDPFDFSDFGRLPATESVGPAAQFAPVLPRSGFDPFAGRAPMAVGAPPEQVFTAAAGTAPIGSIGVAGPPLGLLAAAFGAAVAGVVLAALSVGVASPGSTALLAFAGWLLAGPAAIGVLAGFNGVDTRRRLSSVYSSPTWLRGARWSIAATCAVGIGVGAWELALWAGRF